MYIKNFYLITIFLFSISIDIAIGQQRIPSYNIIHYDSADDTTNSLESILNNLESEIQGIDLTDTNVLFSEDLQVNGVNIGGLTDGYVIQANTSLRAVFEKMLRVAQGATYTQPSVSISPSANGGTYEIGTTLNLSFTFTFNPGDAGAVTSYSFTKNAVEVLSTLGSYSDGTAVPLVTPLTYQGSVSYLEGAVKPDEFGDPDPPGIPAGTKTVSVTYTPQRYYFYGADTSDEDLYTSSAEVRNLGSTKAITTTSTGIFNTPPGTYKVVFAYPSSEGEITYANTKVLGQDVSIVNDLQRAEINVSGANGYSAVEYYVYHYIPAVPYSEQQQFEFRIP